MPEPFLRSDGDVLELAGPMVLDLEGFRVLVARGETLKAARMWERKFAPHVPRGLHPRFLGWLKALENQAREALLEEASLRLEAYRHKGSWLEAAQAAEALSILNPDIPKTVCARIEAYAKLGKMPAAERAYATYRSSGPPTGELEQVRALMDRVRSTDRSAWSREGGDAPFIGRQAELREFTDIFARVKAGQPAFSVIFGEAGIGKTRLLREVRRMAQLEGIRCLAAEAEELEEQISLNPIIDALSTIDIRPFLQQLGEPWRSVIASFLPPGTIAEPVIEPPPVETNGLSRRLLDSFSLLFRELAADQPTMLFIDDFQWCDGTTIAALRFYLRRWRNTRFGIVGAIRTPTHAGTDAVRSIVGSRQNGAWHRIDLTELRRDEAKLLIGAIAGDAVSAKIADDILALTGTHPLYLTESLRDFLEDRLKLDQNVGAGGSIPISVKEILDGRFSSLSELASRVASVLSVGGRGMRIRDLAEICDAPIREVADAVDELEKHGLVDVDRDRASVIHDLFRRALYGRLGPGNAAILHEAVARQKKRARGDSAAGELATHYELAGNPTAAAEFGWIAGRRALAHGAVSEAAHFFELVTRNEQHTGSRARAAAQWATAMHLCRKMQKASLLLESAAGKLRAAGMQSEARRLEIQRVSALQETASLGVDDLVERLAAIKREAHGASDWEAIAHALDLELRILQLDERLEEVRGLFPEFYAVLRAGDAESRAIAYQGLAVGLLLENPEEALSAAEQAVGLASGLGAGQQFTSMNRLLIVLVQLGRLHFEEHRKLLIEARELAEASGDLLQRFSYESNLGVAALDAGELDIADRHFRRAGSLLGSADMTFPRVNLACNSGELALERGNYVEAERCFRSASLHSAVATPRYAHDLANAGLGICALETGDLPEARRREQSIDSGPSIWYYDPFVICCFRARLLERRGQPTEAIDLIASISSELEGRLRMAWLKLRLLACRALAKRGDHEGRKVAEEGIAVARLMFLPRREAQFMECLRRLDE